MSLPAGITPRLLTKEQVAEYLGDAPVAEVTRQGIGRIMLGTHVRYDIRAIDAHLDALSGLTAKSPPTAQPAASTDDPDSPEAALARYKPFKRARS